MNKKIFLLSATTLFLMVIVVIIFNINSNPNPPVEILTMEPVYTPPSEILGDCDRPATTTDCSNIPETIPTPEVIEAQEPPLLDIALNDEHLTIDNTLASVEFCGQTYQARQIFIDGVNVVDRIAKTMLESNNNDPESNLCPEEYEGSVIYDVNYLEVDDVHISIINYNDFFKEKIDLGEKMYIVSILNSGLSSNYYIVPSINKIYLASGYDGSPIGPIGEIK